MTSFETIYVANCKRLSEDPIYRKIYQDLDEVWTWIEASPELCSALDDKRVCICVPASFTMSNAPEYFYDAKAENGQEIYFFDPKTDEFRAKILNRLSEQDVNPGAVKY